MARQETDPNQNYVYILEEGEDDDFPPQTVFRKIGMLQASVVGDGPFYGRVRALQQGNIRPLLVRHSVLLSTKDAASEIEKAIHARLRDAGHANRHDTTQSPGHGEWFAVDLVTVTTIMDEEYAKYQVNQSIFTRMFNLIPAIHTGTKTKSTTPVNDNLSIVRDLFSNS